MQRLQSINTLLFQNKDILSLEEYCLSHSSNEYNKLKNKLYKLEKEHENLLLRIVGVTDSLLRDQLRQDFIDVENNIKELNLEINNIKQIVMIEIAEDIKQDHLLFYNNQFVNDDPITCIEKTNNICLREIIIKKRMRIPPDITYRREVCLIANEINKKIVLLDYESNVIDYIGKGDGEIKLYCSCFLRFNQTPKLTMHIK